MPSAIYVIDSPSGGRYVGSAVDFMSRFRVHRHLLAKGKHFNNALQRACQKYGLDRLIFRVILICRREDLIFFEQRAIDIFKPRYNACPIAGSQLGRAHSPASNEKNAAAHRGRRIHSEEHRQRLRLRMLGNRFGAGKSPSPEVRAAQSARQKGKPRPGFEIGIEKRAAIVAAYLDGLGFNDLVPKFRADHRTLRRILIEENVQIRPRGSSGQISEITRAKLRAAQSGRKYLEETRRKMSQSALRREAAKRIALQNGA